MKQLLKKNWMLVLISLLCVNQFVFADEQQIEKIMNQFKISKNNYALAIYEGDTTTGRWIYKHNFEKMMIPASITKIITSGAVLENLPLNFKYKTQIFSDVIPEKNQIKGSIYLKGFGDPSFVSENMWFLVNAFTRTQVKEIAGDIYIDDTVFDSQRFDDSREDARVDRAYDAPVGAVSMNWNSVNIFVRPSISVGDRAIVFADPVSRYIQLINEVKTVSASGKYDVSVSRVDGSKGDKVIVRGTIPLKSDEKVIYKNITDPVMWTGEQLKEFLKQRGIEVKGEVKIKATPQSAHLIAESESKPLAEIMKDMNKFSNNFVAEMLTKTLAAQTSKEPASLKKGVDILKQYLIKIGLTEKEFNIVNPSGLTRENKITPQGMLKVLTYIKNNFSQFPEFLSSLPVAGFDGTLKNRMKGTPAESHVRAKTGLLTGVVSLAGYAGKKNGSLTTFVFMFNGQEDGAYVRSFFDKLAESLVD